MPARSYLWLSFKTALARLLRARCWRCPAELLFGKTISDEKANEIHLFLLRSGRPYARPDRRGHRCHYFGETNVRQEAGAISRWKSGPGKAQQAAWKRVLRESDGNAGREAYTAVAWGV